ncbi:hypothetical protein ON058_02375 [Demequina sp. B12]|uniref:hypothetical protein n=1 Tax=Demequina sp. B12 TaxID=2992757 RepID=UPI00237AC650|nr:hypothetical protein [Demequina sp. B12]MDE0572258.1 hypothetical protein [Demequina sp. B12]
MNPTTRASITAVAAAVVAGAGLYGTRWLALGVALIMAFMAVGWPRLLRVANHRVSSLVIFGGALGALGAVVIGRTEPFLRYMAVALAAIAIAALLTEVFFASPRGRAVTGVAATAAGGAIAATGAAWVAANRTAGAEDLVVAAAASLAVAAVASVLTSNGNVNGILALIMGGATGSGLAFVFTSLPWYAGTLVGLVAGASVVVMNELSRREPRPADAWAGIASGVTPVLASGVLVYVGGVLLVGA